MKHYAVKEQKFFPPAFSPAVFFLLRIFLGPYVRFAEGVSRIKTSGMEKLYRGMKEHQSGNSRLFIMFRHTAREDAMVMLKVFSLEMKKWCRKNGRRLNRKPHVHILYGKDVLNWSGGIARWGTPRIGGIPVINNRMYRPSLEAIRGAIREGRFPIAFAPETQVTYRMFEVAPTAGGVTAFARWGIDELEKQDKTGRVIMLPVSVGYEYPEGPESILEGNIEYLVRELVITEKLPENPVEKLEFLADRLLEKLEKVFMPGESAVIYRGNGNPESFGRRVQSLCSAVLKKAESFMDIPGEGKILDRVFRLRYKIINTIYREDLDPAGLSPMDRFDADYRALCAKTLKRNEEIVDALEYLDTGYIRRNQNFHRLAEFSMIMRDVINRFYGGNINSRFSVKGKTAHIVFGDPVEFSVAEGFEVKSEKIKEMADEALRRTSAALESEMTGTKSRIK